MFYKDVFLENVPKIHREIPVQKLPFWCICRVSVFIFTDSQNQVPVHSSEFCKILRTDIFKSTFRQLKQWVLGLFQKILRIVKAAS